MVALTSHGSSRADPTRRAVMRIPTLVQRVFGSVTVWRSPSLTSLLSAHANRNAHGDRTSPCAFQSACAETNEVKLWSRQTVSLPKTLCTRVGMRMTARRVGFGPRAAVALLIKSVRLLRFIRLPARDPVRLVS